MKLSHKITALTTTILLSVAVVSPASAAETEPLRKSISEPLVVASAPLTVPETAVVSFERVGLTSVKYVPPVVEAPVVEVLATPTPQTSTAPAPAVAAAPTQYTAPQPATVYTAQAAPVVAAQAPVAPAAPAAGNGGLLGSAYSQLGVAQDCTRMVENALASIGRPVGDLGPAQFLSVGTIVSGPPQPGDILVYGNSHVAIAASSTTAIHGGWNGGTTAVGPIEVGQGTPTVVRV